MTLEYFNITLVYFNWKPKSSHHFDQLKKTYDIILSDLLYFCQQLVMPTFDSLMPLTLELLLIQYVTLKHTYKTHNEDPGTYDADIVGTP
jgi:hypothetical protein